MKNFCGMIRCILVLTVCSLMICGETRKRKEDAG